MHDRGAGGGGDGGGGPEAERIRLLQDAVDAGAEYVDVELEAFGKVKRVRGGRTKLIASWHDFEKTPEAGKLREIHERLAATGADIVKVVTTARDVRDNLVLLELTRHAKIPTIAFAMGEQ